MRHLQNSFFFRNGREKRIFGRICSRVAGEGASVYLEFAFAFPLLIGISLFIVEICMFWDTAVMANHAAFTLARIAKVHCYQSNSSDEDGKDFYPDVQIGGSTYSADKVVTSFFLMSSTYAWMNEQGSDKNVNFKDYFTISKPLFEITTGDDPNLFQKILVQILNAVIKPVEQKMRDFLNSQLTKLLDRIFGKYSDKMNERFNMALQRTSDPKVIVTEKLTLPGGYLRFPSDNYSDNACKKPEYVKVSINYPLHKGGWLYSAFMFWSVANDRTDDTVTANGRFAMLVEPKREIKFYSANDDGSSNLDPEEMKRRAREKAKKIIAEASDLIDQWVAAVLAREKIEDSYGGRDKAAGKTDYVLAVKNETELWSKIQTKCNDYMTILAASPKTQVGLCGDKSDESAYCKLYIFKCWNWGCRNPTDFITCARAESHSKEIDYCGKVAGRIAKFAKAHGMLGDGSVFPKYVPMGTAYPSRSYSHDCPTQYICDQP